MGNDITKISIIIPEALKSGNFLVKLISSLAGVGGVILGIILFTLILKCITLPFDFMSRSSMRKNSLLMEKMRPDLEKLQKQYQGDKQLYNQKMMALYKKNGYSMLGACLPTIITLVVFIVALSAFSTFSTIQTKRVYHDMALEYNTVIYEGLETDDTYIVENQDGTFTINAKEIYENKNSLPSNISVVEGSIQDGEGNVTQRYFDVYTTNGYVYARVFYTEKDGALSFSKTSECEYYAIPDKVAERFSGIDGASPEEIIKKAGAKKAGDFYREKSKTFRFLWVKNVWVADTSFAHPISGSYKNTGITSETDYKTLISDLSKEAKQPNGYFGLVILSILTTVGLQIITTKSQKAQMELQTVNGQGKSTQKIMNWMMPIMMGIFAFMYTSAFSIYMILSSLISIVSTLVINKIVEKKFKKKYATETDGTIRGRVYTPEPVVKQPKKKKKIVDEVGPNDFMSAKVKGKNKHKAQDTDTYHIKDHIRGRLK